MAKESGSDTVSRQGCGGCTGNGGLDLDFTMAFQPIVDVAAGTIFAQEALVRGPGGEGAQTVIAQVNDDNRYRFDQRCRVMAVEWAARLGFDCGLSINFMPNAVYQPERCIQTTLDAAQRVGFPVSNIILEFNEGEQVLDHAHLRNIVDHYQAIGMKTAIDDFGAGFSGLNLLADVHPDYIKLDMALIRGVDTCRSRRAIVKGVMSMCADLDITVIAEGIESREELHALWDAGIHLFQGWYFAAAAVEAAPDIPAERLGCRPV
ncbi:EAL domain-containing protein [Algiphilus sp.]|uniref:EAL domain-containing protein n=1 Tax=Algiphilus sp. TaxID=1872431 RepID=UPI003B518007